MQITVHSSDMYKLLSTNASERGWHKIKRSLPIADFRDAAEENILRGFKIGHFKCFALITTIHFYLQHVPPKPLAI